MSNLGMESTGKEFNDFFHSIDKVRILGGSHGIIEGAQDEGAKEDGWGRRRIRGGGRGLEAAAPRHSWWVA